MYSRLLFVALLLLSGSSVRAQSPAATTTAVVQSSNPPQAAVDKTSTGTPGIIVPPEKSRPVRVQRFGGPPVIDGRLDEEVWKTAAVLKDFYQIYPGENLSPSKPTEVLIGYDEKFLYVGFHAFDDPEKVRATLAKRDAVRDDDHVIIYLDTFNDNRRAYTLYFNPLGVQQDGIYTEDQGFDFSVDIMMESKGLITEDGYTVEVAVPFKSLRYEVGKGKLWGLHALRRIKRFNNEQSSWMPISRGRSDLLGQAGHITGLEGLSTERMLELIPTLTLSETGKRVRALPPTSFPEITEPTLDAGRFVNKPMKFDPGLNVKLGITPTVTLDFALNPDFAEVEADRLVITANQRFPIFFQEKRPFFLEGIDIFQTPLQVVHTRAIIDPDYAVKLTGKQGRNTFGLLLANDNAPGNFSDEERTDPTILPRIRKFLDKNAYIGVLRLKRDVGKDSSLGLIATSYNFIERHNQVGGFDGRLRPNPQTVVTFQAVGMTSRRFFFDPDAGRNIYRTGNAFGYSWSYDHARRSWGYTVSGEGRTRNYRADVGFTRRTNTNHEELVLAYTPVPNPKARLIQWFILNATGIDFDWQGRSQGWQNATTVSWIFPRQTNFTAAFAGGYERLFEEEFGPRRKVGREGAFFGEDPERSAYFKSFSVSFGVTPSKKYSLSALVSHTRGVFDFDFGAGPRFPRVSPAALRDPNAALDPGTGNSWNVVASVRYQPTAALRATLDYTRSRLTRHDTGRVAVDDNLYSLRAAYQFTRFTFARVRIDYSTLSSRARTQLLFGWTPSPGTSFYAGYNDDLTRNGFSPFTGQFEPGLRRNGRTFFVKMSYLFRRNL